jgi:site-specific recombinase XerD
MSDPSMVEVTGPLGVFASGFRDELIAVGYKQDSVGIQLRLVAHLSRWMAAKGVDVVGLTPDVRLAYLKARRASGPRCLRSPKALEPLMAYLREVGAVAADPTAVPGVGERLVAEYQAFLLKERALTPGTVEGYVHLVRPFIAGRVVGDVVDLSGLCAADAIGYVSSACPGRSRGSAKLVVSALRSLLAWLFVTGRVDVDLSGSVPSVAGWRLAGMPRVLEPVEVRRLLGAFDRRTTAGRRDFAMALLMVRLGLRAGEVRQLRLDDVDWRAGELVLRGKGPRIERLPLPADVGEAIAGYLRRGRPTTAQDRTVFVRVHAPHGPLSSGAVTDSVCRAARRAGLGMVHAHVLRHTAATQMMRGGAALPEIGQVLRHRLLITTAIYAKVDTEGLRILARPWPGSAA